MDTEKQYTKKCKPEIGRGCSFCDCGAECEAKLCDGCFKLHETAWLEEYPENIPTDIVEVRFKNTRRSFYQNANNLQLKRGDIVAVEASPGHDIGVVSLTGDLVARQMRRTGFNPYNGEFKKVYRKAKPYDIEKWQEAIALEHETMIASRQIAADMGLNMKIGDVEYQGDKIKAIFYYIADERVDFRELIKVFAERFHIRIEMKQIGARQEAGRIGGLGACGRELCCASWMSSFSSVTTGAARAQEISLNPQKLAGQCSKLKCCMMYEYDTYVDARKEFPRLREPLQAAEGEWFCVKSDVLAGTMTFSSSKDAMANVTTLPVSRVREIMALNRQGKKVERLQDARPNAASAAAATTRAAASRDAPQGRTDRRRRSPAERPASRVKDSPAVPTGSRAATIVRATEATEGSVRTAATAATASVCTTAAATITEAKTTAVNPARTTAANPVKTTEAAVRAETAAATTATAAAETETETETTAETPRPAITATEAAAKAAITAERIKTNSAVKRSAGHIAAVAAALLAGSCVSPHQSAVTDVNPARWDSRAEIRLPNADTVSLRDAVIFLRCNDRFAEDTLTVRIATVTPDSLRFGEWFLLVIPHPKGPAALMREAAIPYRRRIRLTQHGDYRCSVTPVRPVRGVEAVGVDLQQSR